MATGARDGADVPRPQRGCCCIDFWQVPDVLELATIRAAVRDFDAETARIAADWQEEQRRDRRRRARQRRQRA